MFKVKGILRNPTKDYLGFEFDSENLKIAYLKSSVLKKEVIYFVSKNIGGASEEEMIEFIKTQLSRFKIKKVGILYIIPSHLVITRNIEVPSQDPKEIRDIINLQASRHTPYSREEIIVDFIKIGVYRKSYTKILLVIVNRDMVRKQFDILRRAGFEPNKVSFSSEVVVKALASFREGDSPSGLIHIDSTFTDFCVFLKERVIFVRSIPLGTQHLTTRSQDTQTKFAEEIKESLEVYRSEDIEAYPVRLVLTGAIDEVRDLVDFLNSYLKIPVEVVPYFNYFSISSEAQRSLSLSKISSFFGVMSPGLVYESIKVDLTPQEARLKRLFEEKSREIIKFGILVLVFFVVICSFFFGKIYLRDIFLKRLNEKFDKLHKEAELLENDFNRLKIIKDYLSRRGYSLEILAEIYKVLPNEIKISELRFDRKGTVSLKGSASSMTAIFTFVEDLNKSEYFKEVETKYTTKRKEKDRDITDFEIRGAFRKEKK